LKHYHIEWESLLIETALDLARTTRPASQALHLRPLQARSISALNLESAAAHIDPDEIFFRKAQNHAAENRRLRESLAPIVSKDVYNFASRFIEKPNGAERDFHEPTLRSELRKLLGICLPGIDVGISVENISHESLQRVFVYLKKIQKSDIEFASSVAARAKPHLSRTTINEFPSIHSIPPAARALLDHIPIATSMISNVDYKAGNHDAWRRVHITLNAPHVTRVMDSKDGAAMLHDLHLHFHKYRRERFQQSDCSSGFSAITNSAPVAAIKKYGIKELLQTDIYIGSTRGEHLAQTIAAMPDGSCRSWRNAPVAHFAKKALNGDADSLKIRHIKPKGSATSGISAVSHTGQFFVYADLSQPLTAKTIQILDQALDKSHTGI
jgi:hypothetical protein